VIGHNLLGAYLIQRILKAKELKNAVVVSSMSLHVKSTGIKTQEVPTQRVPITAPCSIGMWPWLERRRCGVRGYHPSAHFSSVGLSWAIVLDDR
jgi:hypothetical protein